MESDGGTKVHPRAAEIERNVISAKKKRRIAPALLQKMTLYSAAASFAGASFAALGFRVFLGAAATGAAS